MCVGLLFCLFRFYASVMGRIAGNSSYVHIAFCPSQEVRLLLMARRSFRCGMLQELVRSNECWRGNALRQYRFVVEMFEFGKLFIGGLRLMRPKQEEGLKHFR